MTKENTNPATPDNETSQPSRRDFIRTAAATVATVATAGLASTAEAAGQVTVSAGDPSVVGNVLPPIPAATFNSELEKYQGRFMFPGVMGNDSGGYTVATPDQLQQFGLGTRTAFNRVAPAGVLNNPNRDVVELILAINENATVNELLGIMAKTLTTPSSPQGMQSDATKLSARTYTLVDQNIAANILKLNNTLDTGNESNARPITNHLRTRNVELRLTLRAVNAIAHLKEAGGISEQDAAKLASDIYQKATIGASIRPPRGAISNVPLAYTTEDARKLLDETVQREAKAAQMKPELKEGPSSYVASNPLQPARRVPPPMPGRGR